MIIWLTALSLSTLNLPLAFNYILSVFTSIQLFLIEIIWTAFKKGFVFLFTFPLFLQWSCHHMCKFYSLSFEVSIWTFSLYFSSLDIVVYCLFITYFVVTASMGSWYQPFLFICDFLQGPEYSHLFSPHFWRVRFFFLLLIHWFGLCYILSVKSYVLFSIFLLLSLCLILSLGHLKKGFREFYMGYCLCVYSFDEISPANFSSTKFPWTSLILLSYFSFNCALWYPLLIPSGTCIFISEGSDSFLVWYFHSFCCLSLPFFIISMAQ